MLVLVVLPLLGVAIELVLLLALTGWGLAAKLAFGRPWLVEAVNAGRPERSATYAVKGWERSGKAVDELAVAVSAGDPPKGLSLGPRVARRGPEG